MAPRRFYAVGAKAKAALLARADAVLSSVAKRGLVQRVLGAWRESAYLGRRALRRQLNVTSFNAATLLCRRRVLLTTWLCWRRALSSEVTSLSAAAGRLGSRMYRWRLAKRILEAWRPPRIIPPPGLRIVRFQ